MSEVEVRKPRRTKVDKPAPVDMEPVPTPDAILEIQEQAPPPTEPSDVPEEPKATSTLVIVNH
jgi:hypothetical protein